MKKAEVRSAEAAADEGREVPGRTSGEIFGLPAEGLEMDLFMHFKIHHPTWKDKDKDTKAVNAYIFEHLPLARSLVKRAHALMPRNQRVTKPVDIGKILNVIDWAHDLASLYDNPAFGRDPDYYHWTHLDYTVDDSELVTMIEIARQVERRRNLTKSERERMRVVRQRLEKERELELYAAVRLSEMA